MLHECMIVQPNRDAYFVISLNDSSSCVREACLCRSLGSESAEPGSHGLSS